MQHKKIGELLKNYRKEKINKSVREAAELVGVHYTYLSRLENDISEPSEEVLERISDKYGMDATEKAELFFALKFTPSFEEVMRETLAALGEKKTAEIMFRKSKNKTK